MPASFNKFKKLLGIRLPFPEVVNLLEYTFPDWKTATGTNAEHEISVFLSQFGWTLTEVYEELSHKH